MKFTETHEMNRADEEESEIYANEDIIYDDIRTGTEDSDAKRLQCTGRDSVWNRMYGAVLVCLVLLCVLLLTFIIVLRVQLNAETRQHQMDRENFANKINQVLANNTILIKQRTQLLNKKTDLEKEREELLNKNTDLEKERDKLQNEKTVLKYNETQLLRTIAFLENEIHQKTNRSITNMTSTTTWI